MEKLIKRVYIIWNRYNIEKKEKRKNTMEMGHTIERKYTKKKYHGNKIYYKKKYIYRKKIKPIIDISKRWDLL